jgi:hypothetical protein
MHSSNESGCFESLQPPPAPDFCELHRDCFTRTLAYPWRHGPLPGSGQALTLFSDNSRVRRGCYVIEDRLDKAFASAFSDGRMLACAVSVPTL